MTYSRHKDILANTRSRMTAIMFSRKNDAGSRLSNTQYWENPRSRSFLSQNLKLCNDSMLGAGEGWVSLQQSLGRGGCEVLQNL